MMTTGPLYKASPIPKFYQVRLPQLYHLMLSQESSRGSVITPRETLGKFRGEHLVKASDEKGEGELHDNKIALISGQNKSPLSSSGET